MRRRRSAALSLAAALCTVSVTASGCASNGLASLPLPRPGVGAGGYTVTAIFANALNLPANAKVKLAGADVGQLETMTARNYTAVATLRIMDGVALPVGSTAELRSATPLGDVFVAIKPPEHSEPGRPLLRDGDTIGLKSTQAAATVESVLSSAAILVNGGAARNLTGLINGAGKATGDQGQAFGQLIAKTNDLLARLNSRSAQITAALTATADLAQTIDAKNQTLTELMNAAVPATETLAAHTTAIADLVRQLGDTSEQLRKFPSIGGTDTSGRSVVKDANAIAAAWNDLALAPDATLAALNRIMPPFIKSTSSNAMSVRVGIDRLVLGSIPDIGFQGDIGMHGPKWNNLQQIIGSLKYTLFQLQERVVGKGPGVPQVPVIPSPTEPGQLVPASPSVTPTPAAPADQQAPR
ncbi:mammalian cell entry protein [Mycolicibacterium fortuitum]|uniref:MCE family protein n=1 Tax=Mycolicibacterium fortuitum TaxID=1766 RepID=UPI0007E96911|nr:MCE family protein [Mycolicibacterium fortuitum]OBG47661.1 mammalian cell entry protein [Mycolicibacterium fortuitum]